MRDEDSLAAVLCLIFKLRHSESLVLAKLMTCDCSSKEELHAAVNREQSIVAFNSMSALIHDLRAKLVPYDVQIATISKVGYGLRPEARHRVLKHIAKYEAGCLPAKPKTLELKLDAADAPP